MLPSQSPFPCRWWGSGLEDAGLGDVRPDVGTYGRYELAYPYVAARITKIHTLITLGIAHPQDR